MTETKEKKARGPRKTPLQRMEADRDRYARERENAETDLNVATANARIAQTAYDVADAALKAMDTALNALRLPQLAPDRIDLGKARGEVRS